MINLSEWKLTGDIVAIISQEKKSVYLVPKDKKSYKTMIMKGIRDKYLYKEIDIFNAEFELEIRRDLSCYVKNPKFIDPNEFYLVENIVGSYAEYSIFGEIFSQVDSRKGSFDTKFELISSNEYPGKIFFVCHEMSIYKPVFDNTIREMSIQLSKKTKTRIPGHRYDSENLTYYYLADCYIGQEKYGIVINDYDSDSCKTVSDVLSKYTFTGEEYQLRLIWGSSDSMVDSGESLVNDVANLDTYLSSLISRSDKWRETFIVPILSSRQSVFTNFSSECIETIKRNVRSIVDLTCVKFINLDLVGKQMIRSGRERDVDNREGISKIIRECIDDGLQSIFVSGKIPKNSTLSSTTVLAKMSAATGVNVIDIIDDYINTSGLFDLYKEQVHLYFSSSDLSTYLKYVYIYYDYHSNSVLKNSVDLREKSITYSGYKLKFLKDSIKSHDLCELIRNIVEDARNNYGIGVERFNKLSIGSGKNKSVYETITITLQDIINHFGGVDNVPENIVEDILKEQFYILKINIDEERKLE